MYTRQQKVSRLTLVLVAALIGCGGGTTGTSSTGELKLIGFARNNDGSTLGNTPMSVLSGESNSTLLETRTDASGGFEMQLPGSEPSVVLEVSGKRSPPLLRQFTESSAVSTTMLVDSAGSLSFSEAFEAKVLDDSLCGALEADANEIYQIREVSGEDCRVTIEVGSMTVPLKSFNVEVRGDCDGVATEISSGQIGNDGLVTVDLSSALALGCQSAELIVASDAAAVKPIVFPVYLQR